MLVNRQALLLVPMPMRANSFSTSYTSHPSARSLPSPSPSPSPGLLGCANAYRPSSPPEERAPHCALRLSHARSASAIEAKASS